MSIHRIKLSKNIDDELARREIENLENFIVSIRFTWIDNDLDSDPEFRRRAHVRVSGRIGARGWADSPLDPCVVAHTRSLCVLFIGRSRHYISIREALLSKKI